jgi:hypothetical protein
MSHGWKSMSPQHRQEIMREFQVDESDDDRAVEWIQGFLLPRL